MKQDVNNGWNYHKYSNKKCLLNINKKGFYLNEKILKRKFI